MKIVRFENYLTPYRAEELQKEGWKLEQIVPRRTERIEYEYVFTKDVEDSK